MQKLTYDEVIAQTEHFFAGGVDGECVVLDREYTALLERYEDATGKMQVVLAAQLRALASRMQQLHCPFPVVP